MISGLGFQEILIIAVVVLVVFGPKRLPELMRMAGRVTRDLRRLAWDFRSALDLDSLEQDLDGKPPKSADINGNNATVSSYDEEPGTQAHITASDSDDVPLQSDE